MALIKWTVFCASLILLNSCTSNEAPKSQVSLPLSKILQSLTAQFPAVNFLGYSNSISARGSNGTTGGGGAGGTIILKAPSLVGVSPGWGNLTVAGGTGVANSGGGAGGRIVIEGTVTGSIYKTVGGGYGDTCCSSTAYNGGAGTVYTTSYNGTTSVGSLLISNTLESNASVSIAGLPTLASLNLGGYVNVTLSSGTFSTPIVVDGGLLTVSSSATLANLTVNTGSAHIQDSAIVSSVSMTGGSLKVVGTVNIPLLQASGGTIYPTSANATYGDIVLSGTAVMTHEGFRGTPLQKLYINASNLAIGSGSSINVSGMGYSATFGPGATNTAYKGGGYGGMGGSTGGTVYGSNTDPTDWGSGGYGSAGDHVDYWSQGAGGGVARIRVTGTLTVDGGILAKGYTMGCCIAVGGGSGGSIMIAAGTLAGTGTMSVDGGSVHTTSGAGGGGGGRMAIYYNTTTFSGTQTY
ncbi:MAG: hypothetical protein COT74_07135 [Bdellovibrionales bacterium CG10_big_fil_rev_8_21_14_0_10_45_34]|nr:MAG: hypothetical protein COT74_07135 [Bdellovibrionales bacterium CG10_big_fil_rev_8_21_14_0_10_45_34]